MIRIGLGQLASGVMLLMSGIALAQAGYFVLPLLDGLLGIAMVYFSVDRFDPPSGGEPLRV
jgi:hypothetical protein